MTLAGPERHALIVRIFSRYSVGLERVAITRDVPKFAAVQRAVAR